MFWTALSFCVILAKIEACESSESKPVARDSLAIIFSRYTNKVYILDLSKKMLHATISTEEYGWIRNVQPVLAGDGILATSNRKNEGSYFDAAILEFNFDDMRFYERVVVKDRVLTLPESTLPSDTSYHFAKRLGSQYSLLGIDLSTRKVVKEIFVRTPYDSTTNNFRTPQFLSISRDNKFAAFIGPHFGLCESMTLFLADLANDSIQGFNVNAGTLNVPVFTNDRRSIFIASFCPQAIFHFDLETKLMSRVYEHSVGIAIIKPIPQSNDVIAIHDQGTSQTAIVRFDSDGRMMTSTTVPFLTRFCDFLDDSTLCMDVRPVWFDPARANNPAIIGSQKDLEFALVSLSDLKIKDRFMIKIPEEMYYSFFFSITARR